ncbi:MAG TPA: Rrf2 family transcriptional regulator [Candidatus Sulfotelmatobacter sp.]|nr:Rrf2 family transcriptional regulator [Candidatus Sulfotelmatobacter sp.]
MLVSTKADYATRALQDLAMHYDQGPVQIEGIARRQGLPVRYLEQVLLMLKRAGFLRSRRGVNGGYYLAKPPHEITIGEVLRAVDGPVAPIFCVTDGQRELCPKEGFCALQDLWAEVRDAVGKVVDTTTLEDISQRLRAKQGAGRVTYQI